MDIPRLTEIIKNLITEDGVSDFYFGHQGQFDSMVYSVLKELKAKYPQIRYTVVLAYMPNEHIKEVYGEDTLFPDGLETVPKRFAISKRNDWMILHSDIAVCYVWKVTGGAAKFRGKSEKKKLQINRFIELKYGIIYCITRIKNKNTQLVKL